MLSKKSLTKQDIDACLKGLASEFRKRNGKKVPAEIIIVGGAAAMLNYGFRESTLDVDAYYVASSAMKEAILAVAEKEGLESDWLNNDFQFLSQCNIEQLRLHSKYYKRFANGLLEVRTINAAYLIAMKMRSGRRFRNDLSDIIGILEGECAAGKQICMDEIDRAIVDLFDTKEKIAHDIYEEVSQYVKDTTATGLYINMRDMEEKNFIKVTDYAKKHSGQKGKLNGNQILEQLRRKKE